MDLLDKSSTGHQLMIWNDITILKYTHYHGYSILVNFDISNVGEKPMNRLYETYRHTILHVGYVGVDITYLDDLRSSNEEIKE